MIVTKDTFLNIHLGSRHEVEQLKTILRGTNLDPFSRGFAKVMLGGIVSAEAGITK